jgi:hypothetical protein
MNDSQTLTLCFLGQRDYLHGTTLFDALRPWYENGTHIQFKLGRLMKTDRVQVELLPGGRGTEVNYSTTLRWGEVGTEHRIGVMPLEPSPSPERVPFDEESIVRRAQFEDRSVTVTDPQGESLIRMMVALNKALLFRILTPPLPGQWLFTRLEIETTPMSFQQVSLRFRSNVGVAAVTSSIEVDGRNLGTLMFSWLKR